MSGCYRPTELRVSLSAIRNNFRVIERLLGGRSRTMCVVKADAYGHGALEVSQALLKMGADALAVALPEEGIQLREGGVRAPILVLGGVTEEGARAAVAHHLAQTVYDVDTLQALQREAARRDTVAHAHLKVDTGMTRIGVRSEGELGALMAAWRSCPNVKLEGIFTHFADASGDAAFTREQDAAFRRAVAQVRGQGYRPIAHAAASTGILAGPEYWHDMVRPGICLYGAEVTGQVEGLTPAQRWTTRPVRIERVAEGESIGYGRSYTAPREMLVMTLPVGYGDGYKRLNGNRAQVLVRGARAQVVGRVCMDQIMADVTDVPGVAMGDEVVLLGQQGEARITPDEMAAWCETIPYEIMLSIASRVRRVIE